jgi:hypothetical protein
VSKELEAAREIVLAEGDHGEWVFFANGRGVSVIRNEFSYGGRSGLFEVAVLDEEGNPDYSTPVADDVKGWLTVPEVLDVMKAVSELPAVLSRTGKVQARLRMRRTQ